MGDPLTLIYDKLYQALSWYEINPQDAIEMFHCLRASSCHIPALCPLKSHPMREHLASLIDSDGCHEELILAMLQFLIHTRSR